MTPSYAKGITHHDVTQWKSEEQYRQADNFIIDLNGLHDVIGRLLREMSTEANSAARAGGIESSHLDMQPGPIQVNQPPPKTRLPSDA